MMSTAELFRSSALLVVLRESRYNRCNILGLLLRRIGRSQVFLCAVLVFLGTSLCLPQLSFELGRAHSFLGTREFLPVSLLFKVEKRA